MGIRRTGWWEADHLRIYVSQGWGLSAVDSSNGKDIAIKCRMSLSSGVRKADGGPPIVRDVLGISAQGPDARIFPETEMAARTRVFV
jgi:hypothetical protein